MSTEEGHRNGIIHIIPMTRTIIRTTYDRTSVARPIAFAHVHLRDPIVLSYNTHFLCTTVAYRRMIYRTIKCIAQRSL